MRLFIKRALEKIDALKSEQVRDLLITSAREIRRLETVLDSLPRGILVCSNTHKLILANKAARRFLSIVSYEQGRESIWSVIPDNRIAEFLSHTLVSGDKAEEREFDIEAGGSVKLFSVSIMPLVQDRKVSGSVVLVDDITERRSREAKMRRIESLASLTTLAAGVAHEIKNPLGALSIHIQLIQKTLNANAAACDTNQINKYLSVVNEEIDRLNRIVVDFLFAVRPINVDLRKANINELIAELVKFVSVELEDSKVDVVLNLAENLPPVNIDAGLMKPAMLNLINNAAASMSAGGTLSITTEETEGEVRISFTDTGTGIPEENISKIFEPYFTTRENGTGLGLTVVFKIIKEHHGEINVKSQKGQGSVFIISLPVLQIDRPLITFKTQEQK